jgi:hypothetical protein
MNMNSSNKRYRFFFHYNKPESKRQGKTIWSVHWKNTCFLVDEIKCTRPCVSKNNKRQPYAVMQGWSKDVHITTYVKDSESEQPYEEKVAFIL